MNFTEVALFLLKVVITEFIFGKSATINIMKNFNLDKKVDYCKLFSLYVKVSETTSYQRKRETILNRAK